MISFERWLLAGKIIGSFCLSGKFVCSNRPFTTKRHEKLENRLNVSISCGSSLIRFIRIRSSNWKFGAIIGKTFGHFSSDESSHAGPCNHKVLLINWLGNAPLEATYTEQF